MSMPFEVDSIICGDARELLPKIPANSVPLIVTDPPYGLDYNGGNDLISRLKIKRQNVPRLRPIANDGRRDALRLFLALLYEAKRILVKGGCLCCCATGGGGRNLLFARWMLYMDRVIGFKHAVVWDKGGLGLGYHYRRNYEFILIAQKGEPIYCWNGGKTTPNMVRIPRVLPMKEDQHPTEKPVALMEHFINLHSRLGDLILDPFAGTGATLIAAQKTGRRFLGFEIDPDYCATAKRRLGQQMLSSK